jgi:transcription antitermination factor NusG
MQMLGSLTDGLNPEPGWHALYTRHQHEKMVAQTLTNKGFETFLPFYHALHQWRDRVKRVALPLFPGYVFLRGGEYKFLDVLTTPGVHSLVLAGSLPAVIPPAEIQAIRRAVEKGVRAEPCAYLKNGDWVRVKAGPLEGIEGKLARTKKLRWLVLSVELLERSVAVEIDASLVERTTPRIAVWRLHNSQRGLRQDYDRADKRISTRNSF